MDMSDFEALRARLEQTLSELVETQERLSHELARGLMLSTGMMRDLGVTLTRMDSNRPQPTCQTDNRTASPSRLKAPAARPRHSPERQRL